MGATKGGAKDARREALARLQADQERARRRRERLIILATVVGVLALVIPAAVVIVNAQREQDAVREAAERPIDGVEEFTDLGAQHVAETVEYEQLPPVGGDHNPVWQNCGFYDQPVQDIHAVHSLEHGAVWVTYDPDLDEAQVDTLEALAKDNPYLLVSPYEGLPSPVVASAWGLQLPLDDVDDDRLQTFLTKYLQGPQTLEPGAACTGGISG